MAPDPWKLVLIGLGAGLVSGGFGIGGGVVLVPLLVVVGLDRHRAHATSLAAIVLTAIAGAISFGLSGELELGVGLTVGIGGVLGSVIGASLMHRMTSRNLSLVFGVVLLVAALRMLFGGSPLPGTAESSDLVRIAVAVGIGLFAGFFAGVAGVGGGVVIVPSVVFFLGLLQHEAQGTSLVAILLTASAGTLVNLRNGRVRLMDGFVTGAGGVVGSIVGSRLALATADRTLSIVFGALVLFVALRTLYRAYGAARQDA